LEIAVAIKTILRALDTGLIEKDYDKLVEYLKEQAENNGVVDNDYVNADEQIDLDELNDDELANIAEEYLADYKADLNDIKADLGDDMQNEWKMQDDACKATLKMTADERRVQAEAAHAWQMSC
jgi:hypothetical protein